MHFRMKKPPLTVIKGRVKGATSHMNSRTSLRAMR